MRSFLSMLAALLVAGVIAFSVWKHEGWVTAKNTSINLMINPDPEVSVAGAHDLIAVFSAKILPFSASDRYWLAKAKEIAEAGEFNSAYSYLVLKMRASMAARTS